MKEILILGVNYHSDHETINFIESVLSLVEINLINLIIIDIGERNSDDWFSKKTAEYPSLVTVINCKDNLGYFGAADYGLKEYLKTNSLPQWIIVSNVDIEIQSKDLIYILRTYSTQKEIGVIAPTIISISNQNNQNPFMKFRPSSVRMHFYKWIFKQRIVLNLYELLNFIFKKLIYLFKNVHSISIENDISIYAPHGSFVIFSNTFFLKSKGLNIPLFLFGEEVFIAEICKEIDLKIFYISKIKILHKEHVSTGNLFKNKKIAKYLSKSVTYIADTFFKF